MKKLIPNYPGYSVSYIGNVYSTKYKKPKKLVGNLSAQGYPQVKLSDINGVFRFKRINRLVANAFIPNPNNYPIVLHLDNNPLNNHFKNLI